MTPSGGQFRQQTCRNHTFSRSIIWKASMDQLVKTHSSFPSAAFLLFKFWNSASSSGISHQMKYKHRASNGYQALQEFLTNKCKLWTGRESNKQDRKLTFIDGLFQRDIKRENIVIPPVVSNFAWGALEAFFNTKLEAPWRIKIRFPRVHPFNLINKMQEEL